MVHPYENPATGVTYNAEILRSDGMSVGLKHMFTAATFDVAKQNCETDGGWLFTPHSAREQAVVEGFTTDTAIILVNVYQY